MKKDYVKCTIKIQPLEKPFSHNIEEWEAWTGAFNADDGLFVPDAVKHAMRYFDKKKYRDKYRFGVFATNYKERYRRQTSYYFSWDYLGDPFEMARQKVVNNE